MNCLCTFYKFKRDYPSGLPSKSNLYFFWFKSTVKIWGNFYVQFLQKPSSKFQIFHCMETGIQYMEVKRNVEPAFLKNHTRTFSEILHSGFNEPRSFDFNIKLMLYLWPNYLTMPLSYIEYWDRPVIFYFMPWFLHVERTWRSYFCTVWERLNFNIIVYDITITMQWVY